MQKNTRDLDVIVLDAGHGGEDAGAISINGHKEKDITLAIAKKTREFLKEYLPTTKVVMTRSNDTFIELERRTQIANKSGGKLFLSIHCNSMPPSQIRLTVLKVISCVRVVMQMR